MVEIPAITETVILEITTTEARIQETTITDRIITVLPQIQTIILLPMEMVTIRPV